MIPYYLLEVEQFNLDLNEFSSPSQIGIEGIKDRGPSISFKKKSIQNIDGFIKYDLICEIPQNHKGRAYGLEQIFEYFILIHEKILYYNQRNNILIISASKDVFSYFSKIFSNSKNVTSLKVKKIDVDFQYIINNQYSKGIKGVWLGDYPDINIDSMYLLGNKLEDSSQYKQLLQRGATIKNITILYEYNNKTEKIMITKDGGIILYHQINESDALLLLEDIYTKLFATI